MLICLNSQTADVNCTYSIEHHPGQNMRLLIEGPRKLQGEYIPQGNKNEALPVLCAALLADEPVTLRNLPLIGDVRVLLQLLERLGVELEQQGHEVRLRVNGKLDPRPDFELAQQIRASLLLAPPLLYRQGCFFLPQPGGDKIGRRRIDTHLQVFSAFGASLIEGSEGLEIRIDRPFHGTAIQLDEASVMATENAMMMAAVAVGTTTISNAACEPHVVQLARFLQQLGAEIEGIGTNCLVITGRKQLDGADHTIAEDHIEVGSMIALAAATRSDLIINNITPDNYGMIGQTFSTLGVEFMTSGNRILIPGNQKLEVTMDADGQLPRLHEAPWPGFPPDLSSMAIVLATQVEGPVLFHAWMFESRLFWVDSLISMGARLLLCDPHRVLVIGRSQLYGRLLTSPDIRAGMALLIAGLLAEGETIIKNINQINRGYEDITTRLNALSAGIQLIEH